jgi:hypothetical protein
VGSVSPDLNTFAKFFDIDFKPVPQPVDETDYSTDRGAANRGGLIAVLPLRSWETAVTSCAGANGFSRRMLLGTPREGQREGGPGLMPSPHAIAAVSVFDPWSPNWAGLLLLFLFVFDLCRARDVHSGQFAQLFSRSTIP